MDTPPFISAIPRLSFSSRWLVLFGLSLLLHMVVLQSIEEPLTLFPDEAPPLSEPLPMRLVDAAPPLPEPGPPLPTPSTLPKPKATKKPLSPAPDSSPLEVENVADTISEALAQLPAEIPFDMPTDVPALSTNEAELEPEASEETTVVTAPQYQAAPLPSAMLKYDVQALRKGNMVYGSGKIQWQSDGQIYAINGEASVLFFTLLDFQSEGVVDEYGVSPVLYSQKRFRKAATSTHFQREHNVISFSASTLHYPRLGGEQDRASLIWQLAAIGRGDPAQFIPGKEIAMPVAGVRDLQTWHFTIRGQEEIETGEGKLTAWRVIRIPPRGAYEQRLDIWLAPELGWYPVKLRYTDYNDERLDMILSDLALASTN
jgi:hypothetical protein